MPEDGEIDETELFNESPVVTLVMYQGDERGDGIDIFMKDIQDAEMGKTWSTPAVTSTRDAQEQNATIVFKDSRGAALLIETTRWSDSPNPIKTTHRKLLWVTFGGSD
ncbi:MAG: hypothetical protein QW046_03800 [Candidatus Micrarchaeaceae archaeon]